MTCREKLKMDHPSFVDETFCGGCMGCPHQYGYLKRPEKCGFRNADSYEIREKECSACWDNEVDVTVKPQYIEAAYTALVNLRDYTDLDVDFDIDEAIGYLGQCLDNQTETSDAEQTGE